MKEKMVSVKALDGYRLEVHFSDGVAGIISLKERLFGPVFEPLNDQALFSQAGIDTFGAICWPNGADIAPDAVYRELKKRMQAA